MTAQVIRLPIERCESCQRRSVQFELVRFRDGDEFLVCPDCARVDRDEVEYATAVGADDLEWNDVDGRLETGVEADARHLPPWGTRREEVWASCRPKAHHFVAAHVAASEDEFELDEWGKGRVRFTRGAWLRRTRAREPYGFILCPVCLSEGTPRESAFAIVYPEGIR
jgi:hypothetical protein